MQQQILIPRSIAQEQQLQSKYPTHNPNKSFIIAAVAVNRNREVGICAIDVACPYEILISHIIDTHNFVDSISLLHLYDPVEVLVVDSKIPHPLVQRIREYFADSNTKIVSVKRQYFDQTRGVADLKRIACNCVDSSIEKKYLVTGSLACLIKYIEFIQGVFIAENTIRVRERKSGCKLLMDTSTIISLELIKSSRLGSTNQSLFGMINKCNTVVGTRLLRSTLMNPSYHLGTINARLDLIEVLLNHSTSFFAILEIMPNFVDLDKLMSQLVLIPKTITPRLARQSIGNTLELKQTLTAIPRLVRCLQDLRGKLESRCSLLDSIIDGLKQDAFQSIQDSITATINHSSKIPETGVYKRHQECFAVKAGKNGFLDLARKTFLDLLDKMEELIESYKSKYEINVVLRHSATRGYHALVSSKCFDLPDSFVQRAKSGKNVSCSTKELECLNIRTQSTLKNIYTLSNTALQGLLNEIRQHSTELFSMTEGIAMLDMVLSFTNLVALNTIEEPYTRPHLTQGGNLVITEGRHPIVEGIKKDGSFTPNDVFAEPIMNLQIITGSNCAGKSTYLQMIALITILAQAGCYVPAKKAFIPIRHRLFTRVGTSDDMEKNASSFAVEMKETAFILETAKDDSLILIDELGRGTSSCEGAAIAWSVCEQIVNKKCFCFFATHFHELCGLKFLYPNVKTCYLRVEPKEKLVGQYEYKLIEGIADTSGYGIQMAKECGFPDSLLQKARSFSIAVEKNACQLLVAAPKDPVLCSCDIIHQLIALFNSFLSKPATRTQVQIMRENCGNSSETL